MDITPPKDVGSAGSTFDYSVWSAGTVVTLCNAPMDRQYRNVVFFDNDKDAIKALTESDFHSITIEGMTYCAQGRPIKISVPFSEANRYNYLIARNPSMPVSQKNRPTIFYYFITSVEYSAPQTTIITVQLDVWTTYVRHATFGRCYVERGHLGIAAANSAYNAHKKTSRWRQFILKYLSVPEGMDLGSDYVTRDVATSVIADLHDMQTEPYVIIVSNVDLMSDYGTVDDPKFKTAYGNGAENLPNSCAVYYTSLTQFKHVSAYLADFPWVSQGVISVTLVPRTSITDGAASLSGLKINNGKGPEISYVGGNFVARSRHLRLANDVYATTMAAIPGRYRHLHKFFTYPYSAIEITTWNGTPIVIKPELVIYEGLTVVQHSHVAPPNPRIMFTVWNYNNWDFEGLQEERGGEYFDMATGITNLPTFALVNNSYLSYMASNAHSIAYQHQNADWSQERAQLAMNNSRSQATMGINAQNASTNMANNWNTRNAQYSANIGAIRDGVNAITSISAMTPLSAVGAGINMGINYAATNQMAAMENSQRLDMTGISTGLAGQIRDSNYSMAQAASQIDYQSAIAGINAKVQDAKLIQPTTSGQIGGEAFNIAVDRWEIIAKFKSVHDGVIRFIGEFWLRYGYAMNVYVTPPRNFAVMDHFSYWKCSDTTIKSGTVPEMYRDTLRGILETGVTVWTRMSDIGVLDPANNSPLRGVTIE